MARGYSLGRQSGSNLEGFVVRTERSSSLGDRLVLLLFGQCQKGPDGLRLRCRHFAMPLPGIPSAELRAAPRTTATWGRAALGMSPVPVAFDIAMCFRKLGSGAGRWRHRNMVFASSVFPATTSASARLKGVYT